MYGTLSSGHMPTSMMSMMLGWRMAFAARASLKKRVTSASSLASSGLRTFTAALRPMMGCSAKYTVPMPPSPSSETTS